MNTTLTHDRAVLFDLRGEKCGLETFDGSRGLAADQPLEFGEDQFNRVQVGAVRWQVDQRGSHGRDRFTDASHLVRGEVVHRHEIAGTQMR